MSTANFAVVHTGPAQTLGSAFPTFGSLSQQFTLAANGTVTISFRYTPITARFTGASAVLGEIDKFRILVSPSSGPATDLVSLDVTNTTFTPVTDNLGLGPLSTPLGANFFEVMSSTAFSTSILLNAGTYTLEFRVDSDLDSLFDSGMFVEGVSVTDNGAPSAVPEPSTSVLLGLGMLALAGARKNWRRVLKMSSLRLLPLALCVFAAAVQPALATHFRYGQLSWQRTTTTGGTVRFELFGAFRRNGYSGTAPDGFAAIGNIITENIGATSLVFGDGSAATGTLRFVVLNIDVANNWLYGAALEPGGSTQGISHTYTGAGPWVAAVDSCCRISNSINSPDGSYRLETPVDFTKTNVSPTSTLPIIVQCSALTVCNFLVPTADPDAQMLQFRLATNAESRIAPPSGLSITSGGLATFNTPALTGSGLYSAQIEVEKRDRLNPTNILTKIGVDFLIQVVPGGQASGQNPSFQSPTPACGQTINLQVGQPLVFGVSARSNNAGGNVTLNAAGQPLGSSFSPALPLNGAPSATSTFSFTPSAGQAGQQFQMSMIALDEGGRQATCGFGVLVIAPNTVVRLSATRSGARVRFQWLVSGSLCGPATYTLQKQVGTGAFTDVTTTAATAVIDTLTGPAGTLNNYRVVMSLGCAPPTQSNVVGILF